VQASFWHSLDILDVDGAKPGYGQLFARRISRG
jgi:maleate isomerase